MKVQLCILMSAAMILAAHQVAGEDSVVRERPVRPERSQSHSRRQYTRTAHIHDDKTDQIRVPEPATDTQDRILEERHRPTGSEGLTPSQIRHSAPHIYQRDLEVDSREERSWLVSAVIEAMHQQTGPDNQDEPLNREASGWGWFTDSTLILLEQRERESFLAQDADEDRSRTEEFMRERRNMLLDTRDEQWSLFGFADRESANDMNTSLHGEESESLFFSERDNGEISFDVPAETDGFPSPAAGSERAASERGAADSEHRFTSINSYDYQVARRDDHFSSGRRADDDITSRPYRSSTSYFEERNTAFSSPFDSTGESASVSRFDSPSINVNNDFDRSSWRTESQFDSAPMRSTAFDHDPWDTPSAVSGSRWDSPDYNMPQARDAAPRRNLTETQSPRFIHDMWD